MGLRPSDKYTWTDRSHTQTSCFGIPNIKGGRPRARQQNLLLVMPTLSMMPMKCLGYPMVLSADLR